MPQTSPLLDVNETAALLHRSPAALRYMIQKGTAPKSGLLAGRRFFKASDVYAWIEAAFDKEVA